MRIRLLPLLFLMSSFSMADETRKVLFDFVGADAAREWQTVNDGVLKVRPKGRSRWYWIGLEWGAWAE